MDIFDQYAQYYDLLYQDKDYESEARYVHEMIQERLSGATSVLDLGCGTGGHAFPLADLGYEVIGVDLSSRNIQTARDKALQRGGAAGSVTFHQGDLRTSRLKRHVDVVISLFHVMSYQTSHEDVTAAFATAREHLKPGGLLLFDFWYGPGVLSDPPKVAVKRMADDRMHITRIAEPVMHPAQNIVEINYTVFATRLEDQRVSEIHETHYMRYFFQPELERYAAAAGLSRICFYEWLTRRKPTLKCWSGVLEGVA